MVEIQIYYLNFEFLIFYSRYLTMLLFQQSSLQSVHITFKFPIHRCSPNAECKSRSPSLTILPLDSPIALITRSLALQRSSRLFQLSHQNSHTHNNHRELHENTLTANIKIRWTYMRHASEMSLNIYSVILIATSKCNNCRYTKLQIQKTRKTMTHNFFYIKCDKIDFATK